MQVLPRSLALVIKALFQTLMLFIMMCLWLPSPEVLLLQVHSFTLLCSHFIYQLVHTTKINPSVVLRLTGTMIELMLSECVLYAIELVAHAGATCHTHAAAVLAGMLLAPGNLHHRLAQFCIHPDVSVHDAQTSLGAQTSLR